MRCLTLAVALRDLEAEVQFVCRKHAGNLIELIRRNNFIVHELTAPDTQESKLVPCADTEIEHTRWLGTSQWQDAIETIKTFQEKNCRPRKINSRS